MDNYEPLIEGKVYEAYVDGKLVEVTEMDFDLKEGEHIVGE